jgi:hypothetical protein
MLEEGQRDLGLIRFGAGRKGEPGHAAIQLVGCLHVHGPEQVWHPVDRPARLERAPEGVGGFHAQHHRQLARTDYLASLRRREHDPVPALARAAGRRVDLGLQVLGGLDLLVDRLPVRRARAARLEVRHLAQELRADRKHHHQAQSVPPGALQVVGIHPLAGQVCDAGRAGPQFEFVVRLLEQPIPHQVQHLEGGLIGRQERQAGGRRVHRVTQDRPAEPQVPELMGMEIGQAHEHGRWRGFGPLAVNDQYCAQSDDDQPGEQFSVHGTFS